MSVDSSQARVSSSAAAVHLAAAGNSAISVVGLKKFFGVTRALDGCNFSANLGEIHAIVGGNGCGKSTLAKVLSGVLVADSGRVTVLGRAPASPHEARDLGVATVFQEVLVADDCSVVDNLFMGSDGLFSQSTSSAAKIRAATATHGGPDGNECPRPEPGRGLAAQPQANGSRSVARCCASPGS
jgi:ribose transport system ATP-binding protein